jgi:hypothetical protein
VLTELGIVGGWIENLDVLVVLDPDLAPEAIA